MRRKILLPFCGINRHQFFGLLNDLFPEFEFGDIAYDPGWGRNTHGWAYGENGTVEVVWEKCQCGQCKHVKEV